MWVKRCFLAITPEVMSLSISSLPPDFSWLRPAYRPSDQEVDAYAHVIANMEGCPPETNAESLYREAELQLWIWRTENRQRASRDASRTSTRSPDYAKTRIAASPRSDV